MGDRGPPHCTYHLNSQLAMANGGWVGPPPHHTCHFNSQLPMADGGGWVGPPPHCTCHFNSQCPMADWGVDTIQFTSNQSHNIWGMGVSSTSHQPR